MSILTGLRKIFTKPYRTVGPAEAQILLDDGAILLDVRERHEWQAGHAPKARHIPLGQLAGRLREIPASATIVTACRSGMRSAQAARLLSAEGREVASLAGGMHAWARAGLPVVAKAGPGRVI